MLIEVADLNDPYTLSILIDEMDDALLKTGFIEPGLSVDGSHDPSNVIDRDSEPAPALQMLGPMVRVSHWEFSRHPDPRRSRRLPSDRWLSFDHFVVQTS